MTWLIPDNVLDAVRAKSSLATSGSFGVVAVVLLIALLLQLEATRAGTNNDARRRALSAMAGPLVVAVVVVIGARVASFMP
jgi:hypothetical protein